MAFHSLQSGQSPHDTVDYDRGQWVIFPRYDQWFEFLSELFDTLDQVIWRAFGSNRGQHQAVWPWDNFTAEGCLPGWVRDLVISSSQTSRRKIVLCYSDAEEINDWPIDHNVACSIDKTFRVPCADVVVTRGGFQTSVVSIDDPDDLFVAVDGQHVVLARRGTQS